MASVLATFLHLALMWIYCNGARMKMREVAYLYELTPCEGVEHVGFLNSTMKFFGKDDYKLNITINVEDTFPTLQAYFDTKACTTRALGDCVDMLTFLIEDYCSLATKKGDWNLILNSFEPAIKCPLHGLYQMINFSISDIIPQVKKFLGVGLLTDGTIYFSKLTMKSQNVTIFCLKIVGTFRLVKVRPH